MSKAPEKDAYYHDHYLRTKEKRTNRKRALSEPSRQRRRESDLLWRYGIGIEQLRQLTEAQDNACAICGSGFDGVTKSTVPHIDHRHEPGLPSRMGPVRGLLCTRCNKGLGHFSDSPEVLRAAIAYLISPPAFALFPPKPQLKLFEEAG